MKTRKVEIEIPEDMEVVQSIPKHIINDVMILHLQKSNPRRIVFEEIIGKREVCAGDYWMNATGEVIIASGKYPLVDGNIALRRIE